LTGRERTQAAVSVVSSAGPVATNPPRNVDGVAIAITVFSTVKPWGRAFLPVLFRLSICVPKLTATLVRLSFVHFARWSLVKQIPYNGPPQPKQKLCYAHMYFESNFNGGWEEYIDAFSHIMTSGMAAFWGSSFGFPKALPVGPFKEYISENESGASHYYSAYPQATITMIRSALQLDARLAPLKRDAERMDPEAFQAAYTKMLSDVQRCL